MKNGIGTMINGEILIEFLTKLYSFKIIEQEQSMNVYRENITWTRVKHMRCQQLLCSTTRCSKMRHDIDNLTVKISCYNKQ